MGEAGPRGDRAASMPTGIGGKSGPGLTAGGRKKAEGRDPPPAILWQGGKTPSRPEAGQKDVPLSLLRLSEGPA